MTPPTPGAAPRAGSRRWATVVGVGPLYHVGAVVADLREAQGELSEALGLEWHDPLAGTRHQLYGGEIVDVAPEVVFSRQGPPYLELIQQRPGTVIGETGLHHVGFWTDDVVGTSSHLDGLGCPLEAAGVLPDGTWTTFAYHRTRSGLRVEIVDIGRAGPALTRYLGGPAPGSDA